MRKSEYVHGEEIDDYTPETLMPRIKEILSQIDKGFLESFAKQDERIVIIIAAAYIEGMVEKILDRRFICNRSTKFNPFKDGPLETFSSKLKIAHLIGVINEKTYNLLVKVKNLRNDCAHEIALNFKPGQSQGSKLDDIIDTMKESPFYEPLMSEPILNNVWHESLDAEQRKWRVKIVFPMISIIISLQLILDLNVNHIKHCRGFNAIV